MGRAHPTAQQVHPLLNADVIKERKSLLSLKHGGAGCFGGNIRGSMLVQHLKQQERGDSNPVPYSGRVSLVLRSFVLAPSYLVLSLLSLQCGFACSNSLYQCKSARQEAGSLSVRTSLCDMSSM